MSEQSKMCTPAVDKLMHDSTLKGEKRHNLNESDMLLCIYMIEKFGDDYKKMSKDYKNYYQDTPNQLKKRINVFKTMKTQYEKYLADKKSGVNFLADLEEKF